MPEDQGSSTVNEGASTDPRSGAASARPERTVHGVTTHETITTVGTVTNDGTVNGGGTGPEA